MFFGSIRSDIWTSVGAISLDKTNRSKSKAKSEHGGTGFLVISNIGTGLPKSFGYLLVISTILLSAEENQGIGITYVDAKWIEKHTQCITRACDADSDRVRLRIRARRRYGREEEEQETELNIRVIRRGGKSSFHGNYHSDYTGHYHSLTQQIISSFFSAGDALRATQRSRRLFCQRLPANLHNFHAPMGKTFNLTGTGHTT